MSDSNNTTDATNNIDKNIKTTTDNPMQGSITMTVNNQADSSSLQRANNNSNSTPDATDSEQQQQQHLIDNSNHSGDGDSSEQAASQQQQQQQQQNNNNSNLELSTTNQQSDLPKRNPLEDLFSTKPWGRTVIQQDTPWELPPSPSQATGTSNSSISASSNGNPVASLNSSAATNVAAVIASNNSASNGCEVWKNSGTDNNNQNNLNHHNNHLHHNNSSSSSVVTLDPLTRFTSILDYDFSAQQTPNHAAQGRLSQPTHHMHANMIRQPHAPNNMANYAQVQQMKPRPAAAWNGASSSILSSSTSISDDLDPNKMWSGMPDGGDQPQNHLIASGHHLNNGLNAGNNLRQPQPASSMGSSWARSDKANLVSNPGSMGVNQNTMWDSNTGAHNNKQWMSGSNSGGWTEADSLVGNAASMIAAMSARMNTNLGPSEMPMRPTNSLVQGQDAGFVSNSWASAANKSPPAGNYDSVGGGGIGTWSPVSSGGNKPGTRWDSDGTENGKGDSGRFDDGTAIWGSPAQTKVAGVDWVEKTGDANNGNNDKGRSLGNSHNTQGFRPQQPSSSASLLMSSATSPSNQQARNQQVLKQPLISQNFDQVHQPSNALSSQSSNQPNRILGLSSNVPSTQQLKHMVQQIQIAVQAGHLNAQILNQPLAPITLQLLYQLLQQIKVLHQLQLQAPQQYNKTGNHPVASINVQITKTKQTILNLQNQIAAQQAVFLKQTQTHNISAQQPSIPTIAAGGVSGISGPTLPPGISQSGDSFRTGAAGDIHNQSMMNNASGLDGFGTNGLTNNLNNMSIGGGVMGNSRFDQSWRAPATQQQNLASSSFANNNLMNNSNSMQKSILNSGGNGNSNALGNSPFVNVPPNNEFARAPGPGSSMMDNKPFPMGNRSSAWSAFGASEAEPEWPNATTSGISASNSTQPAPTNAFDLVPEFEPGKPWRGTMLMKSIEDDPTMTPGSMARSLAPQRKTIWSDEL